MWEHTLSTISMNAWASCPERFSTVLTSLASEKIVAIRATCSSTVRVLLINCFQAGAFDRSTVRQKGYLRTESQASLVGKLTWCTPRNIFGLLFQVKKSLASRQVLARPVTHLSFASSIPQRGSLALVDVPIDPVVSEGAGVHDPREAFHLGPCGTDCGIYSQFVNHDLRSKNQKGLEVRRRMAQTRSVPGCITSIHARSILSGSLPRQGRIIRTWEVKTRTGPFPAMYICFCGFGSFTW